ncbi:MAG: protein serine/threonine phosphatase [Frankiales bacterium]|nr:protein serine/threonine phosphatase [Frankiales bacterium]
MTAPEITERALDELARAAEPAAPHDLAALFDACARRLGAEGCVVYVADLQQRLLQPLLGARPTPEQSDLASLAVDGTLAGRAYQLGDAQSQTEGDVGIRVWLPVVVGSHRLGVMTATFHAQPVPAMLDALRRLADAAAVLVQGKSAYGDAIIRLRRTHHLGVAAELHYSVLPPLSFSGTNVTVSAALEPCYEVAGDVIDYSVDDGHTQVALFDGMGHGLHSAQCAVFTVAAYRSARRSGLGLIDVLSSVDDALLTGLGGELFSTAVMADLDTDTGRLRWVNAGHPFPLLLRDGRVVKALETEPRPPLGLGHLVTGGSIEVGAEQLEPGDMVLLYTDGVVEARSPAGEFFGVDRLSELVCTQLAGGLAAPETMRRVVRDLLTHHEGQLTDDATLLMLEWHRPVGDARER